MKRRRRKPLTLEQVRLERDAQKRHAAQYHGEPTREELRKLLHAQYHVEPTRKELLKLIKKAEYVHRPLTAHFIGGGLPTLGKNR